MGLRWVAGSLQGSLEPLDPGPPQVQAGTIHPAVTSLRAKVTEAQAGGFLLIQAPRDRPARPGTTVSVVLKDISPVAPSHFYYLVSLAPP